MIKSVMIDAVRYEIEMTDGPFYIAGNEAAGYVVGRRWFMLNATGEKAEKIRGLTMENKLKRISDTKLLDLHMITCAKHGYSAFFADVYDAVSELIERRKAAGEWKGLNEEAQE